MSPFCRDRENVIKSEMIFAVDLLIQSRESPCRFFYEIIRQSRQTQQMLMMLAEDENNCLNKIKQTLHAMLAKHENDSLDLFEQI